MDKFNEICRKIKSVEIQGARNVAKAAIQALMIRHDEKSVKKLLSLRPTEPAMRKATNFAKYDPVKLGPLALGHFDTSVEKIAEYGSKKIKDGMKIFTHCHSSTVMAVFKKAKKQGKKFEVHCTETRPLFQGRRTAGELKNLKIPVTLWVDSGAREALQDADLFFFGADAISKEGHVANKIGTAMFAEIAKGFGIRVYSCADSWKFDNRPWKRIEIERRSWREVWPGKPTGVKIENPAFEFVNKKLIDGIITELGILKPGEVGRKFKENYPSLK